MKNLTASIIHIELQADKYVQKPYPKYLHGLCYHLAGEHYPHPKFSPPEFHPYIKKWKSSSQWGTKATIEIGCINNDLTFAFLETLKDSSTLRLGSQELKVASYQVVKQENISLDRSLAIPVPKDFKISFATPTKFRTRGIQTYETKAYPDIRLMIRSLARNLHILYDVRTSKEELERLIDNIILVNAIGHPVQSKIDKKATYDNSFIGEIQLSCEKLSEDQLKLFGLLLKTARYTGVGHHKGYGYGHIEIKRATNHQIYDLQ